MSDNEEVFGARFEIDVSNLKSGITQANRYVKQAESEFKAAAAGMDDWRNSEEGLTAKLKSLNSVSDAQAAKVEALQKAYDETAAEMGETSAAAMNLSIRLNNAQADFNKTQKEIKQTDTALNDFRSGANEAGDAATQAGQDAAKAGDNFGDFSNNVVDTVKQLGGIAIAGMGISSIAEYIEGASGASSRLNATLGVTGDKAAEFDDALNNIYANNYGESFDDIAESASRVGQIMGNDISPEALESVTTSALILRDTFDMDVNESVKAAKVMMSNFGMTSEEAFDMIAAGAQQGLNINDDMLDSFSEYSPYFAQIGLSADDMFTAFKSGADISMYGVDKAGDAFKEFGIRVLDGSDTTAEAFDAMGLDMDEYAAKIMEGGDTAKGATSDIIQAMLGIEDPIAQNIAGVNLFGTQWEDLGQDGANAMLSLMGTANDTAGTLDEIDSIRYDDIGNSLSAIGRTIQDSVLSPLVDSLTPAISDFSQNIIPVIKDGAQWFIDNLPTIAPLLSAIAGGMAAFAVASTIQSAVDAVNAFKKAQEAATVAQALFNAVMNANRLVVVVTIIGALVAALIYFWNTNEDFRNAVMAAWDAIASTIGGVVDGIVNFFTVTVPEALASLGEWFSNLPETIGTALGDVLVAIGEWATNIGQSALQAGQDFLTNIGNFFSQLPQNIWNFLVMVVTSIGQWESNMIQFAIQAGSQFLSNIVNFFSQLPGNIMSFLSNVISNVGSFVGNMASGALQAGSQFISNIVSNIQQAPGKIMDILSQIPGKVAGFAGDMAGAAGDMIQGLINGIGNGAGAVVEKIKEICSGALDAVKNFFGIHSPSRVMKQMGEFIDEGLEIGIADGVGGVAKAAQALSIAATPDIEPNAVSFSTGGQYGRSDGATSGGKTVIFNQTNNSPKALTPRDTYRQGLKLSQTLAEGV